MDIEVNYDYETINEYLTEKNLGEFLKEFLPSSEIIHDKKVPNSNVSYRPDYRIENIKLIIEYNGHHHYTIPENILNDYKKREAYESMGYIVKSIPYWIQLRVNTIHYLFIDRIPNLDTSKLKDHTTFPMGFISKKCVLPSKFCELGIREMLRERKLWDEVHDKYYKYFDFTLIY